MESCEAPEQETSDYQFCSFCHIWCDSQESLQAHFLESKHIRITRKWAIDVFGFRAVQPIKSLQDLFQRSWKRGQRIGLQYLKTTFKTERFNGETPLPYFACTLCGVLENPLFLHLCSKEHKVAYIAKHFSFLFEDVESFSAQIINDIAVIIDEVEGFEKFKLGVNYCDGPFLDLPGRSSASDNLSRQTVDKIVELLKKRGITFKNPCGTGNEIPHLQTELHVSETNEKKDIITSVASEKSAVSEIASSQVDDEIRDQPQMHGIEFKDAGRKENDVPCLQAGSRDFEINVNSGKRPLGFAPVAECKLRKSELPNQHAGKPIISSLPVPVSCSVSDPSVVVPAGKNMHGCNSLQENKLRTTSFVAPVKEDIAPKHIPSLCSSHADGWVYETARPPAGEYSPSWPPAVPFYQNAKHEYGYSDQSLYEFANKSAYEQARSVSDFGKANTFEGQARWLESGHPGAHHLHTLGATGGSISSVDGPSSSVASVKHDRTSRNGYNSVDSKEFFSKSSSPSQINSFLNEEPSLSQSLGDSCPPEYSFPTTSTSSPAQTSQSTNLNMPAKAASMLSPHTLKILQGREPESVKSILTRLAEYCPELQQVNISLLVDVLFEAGALR